METKKVDLLNYTTNFDLKRARGIDASKSVKEAYLVNLKRNFDDLGINKFKTIQAL